MALRGLRLAAKSARARARAANDAPLSRFAWLPPQHAFLSWQPREGEQACLLRTGNRFGKTTAGLAEVIGRCIGEHVLGKDVPEPPVTWWVVCAGFSQSVEIQEACWEMLPKSRLASETRYSARWGFGANNPAVVFDNGSVIRFKTTHQDALNLAGATLDGVLFDEPPRTREIYSEVRKRLMTTGGPLLMTLTPINAPTDWLRAEVERGAVVDLHFRWEAANFIPVGKKRPLRHESGERCDAAWVQRKRDEEPPWDAAVRLDGEWEDREGGRRFGDFVDAVGEPGSNVVAELPNRDLRIGLGIDHGETGQNQAFFLVGIDEASVNVAAEMFPVVGIDEHVSETTTTVQQDAMDVLAMLDRNGLEWEDLAFVGGDNPTSGRKDRKDNLRLTEAILRELRRRHPDRYAGPRASDLRPRITAAKQGRLSGKGSLRRGERWLDKLIVAKGFTVHECCVLFRDCMRRYDGTKQSEHKHLPDACRYALNEYIKGYRLPSREQIAEARRIAKKGR